MGSMSRTVVEAREWVVRHGAQVACQGISRGKSDLKYFDHRLSVIACSTPGF